MTKLTRNQTKVYGPYADEVLKDVYGDKAVLTVTVRYDDQCENGHNTFSITGAITVGNRIVASGSLHDDIVRVFPELAPYVKWHLTSTDGPLHYEANTLFWLGYDGYCDGKAHSPPHLENARRCAVWPDMPDNMLVTSGVFSRSDVIKQLAFRLPTLMADFQEAVDSLGFEY